MSAIQQAESSAIKRFDDSDTRAVRWWQLEDWWAVAIALVLVVAAYAVFVQGGSLKGLVAGPAKWVSLGEAGGDLAARLASYGELFVLWAVLLGVATAAIGRSVKKFLPGFLVLFVVSVLIFEVGAWSQASHYNLEPPLVALVLGLIVSNLGGVPAWLEDALRVEFYIKIGIVLLGATLPLTLIAWAGPVAVGQAAIVSLVTFFTIFFVARLLGLEQRFAAVLGVGGAVCGVSAAIAVAGAIRAKREQASVAITLVIVWAIVSLLVLPFVARELGLSAGIGGAWIGTSEFADAAGVAAAQAYGDLAAHSGGLIAGDPDSAVKAFTLMKVVGRDIWIGIWAFVLAIVATARWDVPEGGVRGKADAKEIWRRFPKFVIGFVLTSIFITWVASHYRQADYAQVVTPAFVAPITALRTWAFIFCFLSIGLSTKFATLAKTGVRPFVAFTVGVAVNVVIGYILSVHVFGAYWNALG